MHALCKPSQNFYALEILLTDLESLVQTDTFAKRAREDVGDVLRRLHDARRDKKEPLFTFGTELYGATLVEGET